MEILASCVRSAGDLAGVFEFDGDTGYFYLHEVAGDVGRKVVDHIHVLLREREAASIATVRWDGRERRVGFFVGEVLWAFFDVESGAKLGGRYRRGTEPALPADAQRAFPVHARLDHCSYVVVNVFPLPGSEHFRDYCSGVANCWIREDRAPTTAAVDQLLRRKLESAGWGISGLSTRKTLSDALEPPEGRRYFDQCLMDGFVTQLRRVEREYIGAMTLDPDEIELAFFTLAAVLRVRGGYSLYSAADDQYANGVTPNENEFLPLWATASEAADWIKDWPGYAVHEVPADRLHSDFLDQVEDSELVVGLGLPDRSIATFDAIGLKRAITPR